MKEGVFQKELKEMRVAKVERQFENASLQLKTKQLVKPNHYRYFFDHSVEGYAYCQLILKNNVASDFIICELNPAFEKILGWKNGTGERIRKMIPGIMESNPELFQFLGAVATNGEPQKFELFLKPLNLWLHISSICPEKGFFIVFINDIGSRKKVERELQESKKQMEELQKIIKEKDKFFSIIAHDLRSPFASVMGASELLSNKIKEGNLSEIQSYSEIITKLSHKATDLLMDLTQWSRSQDGLDFNPEYFELGALMCDVVSMYQLIAEKKSITLKLELPASLPICADKNMISTVLRNGISNAIKFTLPGGMIILSAEKNQKEVQVKIADSGVGISPAVNEKLFKLSGKYSTPGTQNEQGTGMGLIFCKDFIEKHNGKIWIESVVGKGSNFIFTLPIVKV